MRELATDMLTVTQALQLVGLVPSLFVTVFLLTLLGRNRQVVIPIFYFLALAASFVLPLTELYESTAGAARLNAGLLLGESTLAAFCFLLVMQFILGRVPPAPYWLVLAIPIIGGSPMIYAGIMAREICLSPRACYDVESIKSLYHIFASALVFLLLIYYASRAQGISGSDTARRHKYWLMVVLILLHLLVLAADLGRLSGRLSFDEAQFTVTVLRLSFIYLVLTSLFRVFYPALAGEAMQYVRAYHPELDHRHVEKITSLLEKDRVYREMRLNRAALAAMVGISEYHLSRVINGHFKKNFNELINGYRIEEAKRRLTGEPGQQVTVIGFETGFNSIASFNRVFKEMTGMSPTEYRSANNRSGSAPPVASPSG
jgi:AraC-like DNA-binding protein